MTTVYAFEWCECIYESGFSVQSLHDSKTGAYRAMKAAIFREWSESRLMGWRIWGKARAPIPLHSSAWRVKQYIVETR